MKKYFLALLTLLCLNVEARMVGPYFGANWQYTNIRSFERDLTGNAGEGSFKFSGNKLTVSGNATAANNGSVDVDATTRGHGLRLNFGYQMNSWLAWDLSYNHFSDAEWKTSTSAKAINRQFTFDVAGLVAYPVTSGVYATGRGGLAFLRSSIDFDGTVLGPNNFSINNSVSEQIVYSMHMIYGLGMSYDFNRNTALNFDVIQYRGSGNIDDATNFQLGLTYYFGG